VESFVIGFAIVEMPSVVISKKKRVVPIEVFNMAAPKILKLEFNKTSMVAIANARIDLYNTEVTAK
jgi:hypothetical protein